MPEVRRRSEPSAPRDMLPPDFQDELKKPETFPQARPEPPPEGYTPVPPPLPGCARGIASVAGGLCAADFKPPTISQSGEGSGDRRWFPSRN